MDVVFQQKQASGGFALELVLRPLRNTLAGGSPEDRPVRRRRHKRGLGSIGKAHARRTTRSDLARGTAEQTDCEEDPRDFDGMRVPDLRVGSECSPAVVTAALNW
jgi:hypothetical protein